MSFNGSVWVRFNFIYLFINNQLVIELFTQDIIRLGENLDPYNTPQCSYLLHQTWGCTALMRGAKHTLYLHFLPFFRDK